jgi:geranylgeranyl pyrophosphate synthase
VDKAQNAIAELPESEAKMVLQTMAQFVISRPM